MLCVSFTQKPRRRRRNRRRHRAVTTFSNIKCFNKANRMWKIECKFFSLILRSCVRVLACFFGVFRTIALDPFGFIFICKVFPRIVFLFVLQCVSISTTPRKSDTTRIRNYYNPANGCIEALNCYCDSLFAHLLLHTQRRHIRARSNYDKQSIFIINETGMGHSLFMCVCVPF